MLVLSRILPTECVRTSPRSGESAAITLEWSRRKAAAARSVLAPGVNPGIRCLAASAAARWKSIWRSIIVGHPDTGWTDHLELAPRRSTCSDNTTLSKATRDARDPLDYRGNRGHGTKTASVIVSRGTVQPPSDQWWVSRRGDASSHPCHQECRRIPRRRCSQGHSPRSGERVPRHIDEPRRAWQLALEASVNTPLRRTLSYLPRW